MTPKPSICCTEAVWEPLFCHGLSLPFRPTIHARNTNLAQKVYLARFFDSPPSLSTLENNKNNSHQINSPLLAVGLTRFVDGGSLLLCHPEPGGPKECWLIGPNSLIGRKRSSQKTMQDSWIRWVKHLKWRKKPGSKGFEAGFQFASRPELLPDETGVEMGLANSSLGELF